MAADMVELVMGMEEELLHLLNKPPAKVNSINSSHNKNDDFILKIWLINVF